MSPKSLEPEEFLHKAQENHEKAKNRRKRGDRDVFFFKARNLYVGQLSVTDPETGKRSRPKVYAKTEKEARAKMRALERQIEEGRNVGQGNRYTVGEWMNHYYKNYRKFSNIAIKTLEAEEMWIRVHIIPGLGNKKLAKLTTDQIQTFYRQRLDRPQAEGGPLSPQSIHHIHGVLHRGLRKAVELKYISSNPTENVELPRMEKLPLRALRRDQIQKIIDVANARKFRYLTAIILAVMTGLRRSEVFGLRWSDIDMENGIIRVQQVSLTTQTGVVIVSRTKTKRSQDAVAIPPSLIEELRAHAGRLENDKANALAKAEKDREKFGEAVNPADYWEDNDFVFKQENGRRADPKSVSRTFKQILVEAGFPDARLHDLRHTFIALLIDSGVHAKKVQMAARHSSIDQTLDRYGHLFNPVSGEVAEVLDGILADKKESPLQEPKEAEENPGGSKTAV